MLNKQKINVFLILGILLWTFSLMTATPITRISSDNSFGLFQELPIWFFLSIVLITISAIYSCFEKSELKFILILIILSIFIFGTPYLVEQYPREWDSYWHVYTIKYIIEHGYVSTNLADFKMETFYIEQWPSTYILFASLIIIANITYLFFLKTFVLWFFPIIFFNTYVLFKILSPLNRTIARVSILIFILTTFYFPKLFSPATIALAILPLIILSIFKQSIKMRLIFFILLIDIILSHPTTALFFVIFFSLFLFIKYIPIQKSNDLLKSQDFKYFMLTIICFIAYLIYIAVSSFNGNIKAAMNTVFLSDVVTQQTSISTFRVMEFLPVTIQYIYFGTVVLVSIYYIIIPIIKKRILLQLESIWLFSGLSFMIATIFLGMGFLGRTVVYTNYIISFIVATLYITQTKKYSFRFILLLLLIITYTFYWEESPNIYSDKNIYEYERAYALSENKTLLTNNIYPPNLDSPMQLLSVHNITKIRISKIEDIKNIKTLSEYQRYETPVQYIFLTERMISLETKKAKPEDSTKVMLYFDSRFHKIDDFGFNYLYYNRN